MRLFEAIVDANHRASSGDVAVPIRPEDFPDALPLAILTCVYPRLNTLISRTLNVPERELIWLRNAGNSILPHERSDQGGTSDHGYFQVAGGLPSGRDEASRKPKSAK